MRKYTVTYRKQIADSGSEKKYINPQIGRGYETRNGHIDIIINSIPLNWDGKARLWIDSESLVNEAIIEPEKVIEE